MATKLITQEVLSSLATQQKTYIDSKATAATTAAAADVDNKLKEYDKSSVVDGKIDTAITNIGATVKVDASTNGTPSATVKNESGTLAFEFSNLKGDKGDQGTAAGFGTVTASVDATVGTPGVTVTTGGTNEAKTFDFKFTNLKGETGAQGPQGEKGATSTIKVGTVKAGTPGSTPTVVNVGTDTDATFDFTIPQGLQGEAAGFGDITATVDANVGTPGVTVTPGGTNAAKTLKFDFTNLKGEKGDKGDDGAKGDPGVAAGFGTPTATVSVPGDGVTAPSVTVTTDGPDTAKVFAFDFKNIKGAKGDKGDKGDAPEFTAAAGTNINTPGTPTVTLSGTANGGYTLTFDYLKGSAANVTESKDFTDLKEAVEELQKLVGSESIEDSITEAIAKILGEAPDKFDTFKEVAKWIEDHESEVVLNLAKMRTWESVTLTDTKLTVFSSTDDKTGTSWDIITSTEAQAIYDVFKIS